MAKSIHPISVNSPPKETTPIKMEQRSVSDSYVVAPGLLVVYLSSLARSSSSQLLKFRTPLPDFSQASAHSLGFVRHSTSPSTFTSQPEKEEKVGFQREVSSWWERMCFKPNAFTNFFSSLHRPVALLANTSVQDPLKDGMAGKAKGRLSRLLAQVTKWYHKLLWQV